MPIYRAREQGREQIYGDEAQSYRLLPDYVGRMKETDKNTYDKIRLDPDTNRFQAIFVALGSLIYTIRFLRPLFTLDRTHHIRSKYNLTIDCGQN